MHRFRVTALIAVLMTLLCSLATAQAPPASPTPTQPPAPSGAPDPAAFPDVVAKVNGVDITKAQLVDRGEVVKRQMPNMQPGPDFYDRVLDDLVSSELLYQSAVAKGLLPTEADIDAAIDEQQKRLGGPDAFNQALDRAGLNLDDVRGQLKRDMGIQKMVEEQIIPTLTVSEEDKRKFYDENASQMQQPGSFKVDHILIAVETDADQATKDAAKKKAESLRSMIEAGQDFGELAGRNSDDPGSAEQGGSLPWMDKGQTVPPFEAAALALSPGEMSPVVETQFGYHIIKLVDKKAAGVAPYEDVEERIDFFLKQQSMQERLQQEVDTLRSAGTVEVLI